MPTYQEMHSSRLRRSKHSAEPVEAAQRQEENEMNGHFHTPMLQPEEPPTTPTRSVAKRIDVPARLDDSRRLGYTKTSPNARHAFTEANTATRGLVPMRRYMAVSTSDSMESAVVFHSPDQAAVRVVSGVLSASEPQSSSSGASPMKVGSDAVNLTLVEDDDSDNLEDRGIEDDQIDDGYGAGVVFELYKPMELRRAEHTFSKGSPLPPAVLTRRLPAGGVSGRRYNCSNGSREQVGGRYPTLSQSSRLEDIRRLPPHGGEMCKSSNICVDRTRTMTQEDMVRNSSADSFSIDGAGTVFQNSGQPQRIDSSMNSQFFFKSRQRRNGMNTSVVHGCSHHDSMSSPSESPQMSADVAAPTLLNVSGPHLLCSDQVALISHCRGQSRHTHANHHLNNHNHRHSDGDAAGEAASLMDGIVLGMASVDPLTGDGGAGMTTSLSMTDGFDLVRTPITGLRAMVLGNNAVEEEEAAEDPEMRARQAEQLKHFYSKVVRQHRNCAKSGAPAGGNSLPTSATGSTSTLQAPQVFRINDTAADCVAPVHEFGAPILSQSSPLGDEGRTALVLESVVAKKSKKREKRVMFNINGMEQPHTAGGGVANLPHHGTPQPTCALVPHAPSPLALQYFGIEMTSSSGEAEVNDLVTWESPLPPASLRMARRAGDMQNQLKAATGTTRTETLTSSADGAVPALLSPVTPVQGSPCMSSLHTPRRENEDDEHLLTDPLTPSASANFAQQQLPTFVRMATASPSPPAPPSTILEKLSIIFAEAPRKRCFSGGKASTASTKHRKAAMALVAGAGDAIVLPQSSTTFVPPSRSPYSHLVPPNVLNSLEVCLPDRDSSKKGSSRPRHPPQTSLCISCAQTKYPSPLQSVEGSVPPVQHIKSRSTATQVFMPPWLRAAQAVSDRELPSEPMQKPSITVPMVVTAAAGLTTEKRNGKLDKKSRCNSQHSSASSFPIVKSHAVKTDPPLLPTQSSIRLFREESPREWASSKPSSPSVSGDEVSVLRPSALKRHISIPHKTTTTAAGSGAGVGAGREQQMSEFTKGTRSISGDPDTTSSSATRSSGHAVPSLLAITVPRHT
ncbi:hypothetical protein LMJF_33_3030 [Leishmania major strain Friedlin]|uniref:Uncharacterized protein n=1 Tax=Leishmania major TaxID=5664 RepID=Q4Q3N3_LEIMA|nr:hypothetical protein LMJF_33_3030 [Leishmania major strain Friedlin]CAG9581003.1 hypothetical_protein_-_conserved [Leishmania major strain Friedlin]CAJ06846.1 hypothetical protein LMJF_33_3030 [Leishmania major strain Friedlin]|eukprot:XP_001686065.1 hypothetical protein LMJF_33_3030 [Leishmania major strain Friedlin]